MTEKRRRTRLVIVGNGMAGSACLEELLKAGPGRFEITVFGAERYPNYNRVLLSSVLTGEKTLDDIMLHGRPWYEENGVTLRSGIKVTGCKTRNSKDDIDNRRSLLERIGEAIRQTVDPWKKRPREDAPGFV